MLIWGTRWSSTPLGQIAYQCSRCGKKTVHSAFVRNGKFTLFFIPLFPIGTQYLIQCNLCGMRLKAVSNLLAQLQQWHKTGVLPEQEALSSGA